MPARLPKASQTAKQSFLRQRGSKRGQPELLIPMTYATGFAHGLPFLFRKEVIQPQVLLRLPCYDFTPIMSHTLGRCLLTVSAQTSSTTHFRDVTGGVYKARERIHGVILIRHY
jgi:hypothetical protein